MVGDGAGFPAFTRWYPSAAPEPARLGWGHPRQNVCNIARLAVPYRLEERMKIIRSKTFTAERAWGALDIANMHGITVRLHWTDQPYRWHVNTGEEVFAVLDGAVDMHFRDAEGEQVALLAAGDIFHAQVGCEHVARPRGEARILVVEHEGSE